MIALSTAACAGAPAEPTASPAPRPAAGATLPERTGTIHDFDWIAGGWTVHNRRLKARWVGSTEWDEFPAVDCATIYLDGVANVDELQFPTKGWAGVTLRTFNVARRQWSIYWVNSRNGELFPPVVGGFDGNRGEFYGEDTDDGRPVKVRFVWTTDGPDRAHWEQSFSLDGQTWELNWMNDFIRDDTVCAGGRPRPGAGRG